MSKIIQVKSISTYCSVKLPWICHGSIRKSQLLIVSAISDRSKKSPLLYQPFLKLVHMVNPAWVCSPTFDEAGDDEWTYKKNFFFFFFHSESVKGSVFTCQQNNF